MGGDRDDRADGSDGTDRGETDSGADGASAADAPGEAILVADLRRVAARADTSDPPTSADLRTHGAYGPATHRGAFGSLVAAHRAAGLRDGRRGRPTADAVRADLRRVARREDTADPPTADDYDRRGAWSVAVARQCAGGDEPTWAATLDAAGLDGDAARRRGGPPPTPGGADPETVAADLRRVAARDDTADPPTTTDYEAHGRWSTDTVYRHLEAAVWADAIGAAGLDGDAARGRSVGAHVPDASAARQDVRRVAARPDTRDPPSRTDYDAHGEWTAETVARHLGDGSWAAALDAADLDGDAARRRGGTDPPSNQHN